MVEESVLRERVEQDLDDELRAFLEMTVEEKRAAGMTEREARRAALIELGGLDQVKDAVRDARTGAMADELRRDVAYAWRMLARNPAFTAVAVLTLALGVGANAAVFTVVDAVVFRPLPYEDPERLVKIWSTDSRQPTDNLSSPDLDEMRGLHDLFAEVAADDGEGVELRTATARAKQVGGAIVTSNWLSALGVRPFLGRAFCHGRDRSRAAIAS